jgi:hypothetical protein
MGVYTNMVRRDMAQIHSRKDFLQIVSIINLFDIATYVN